MKVKIQQRSVYHKYAEVEIDIDENDYDHWKLDNGKYASIQDFLIENDDLYIDKIDDKMSKASYEYGMGVNDYEGMEEFDVSCERRYEIVGKKYGGHL
jgi:hypothetical protein